MKRMLKNYTGARVKPPRKSQLHPINFYNLDDTFPAMTILPRFANRNERISLVNRLAIQLSRESLTYYATPTIAKTMYSFAKEVERSLALKLSRSVPSCNCGPNAGWCSKSYDLGMWDKPVEVNSKNAVDAIANLANCLCEIPSMDGDDILVVPPHVVDDIISANDIRTCYGPSYDPPKFRFIRDDVREVGKFTGRSLFVDEAITGQNAAYAIRHPAVDWNFRFYSSNYFADRDYTILELHYGFLVTHPEYIAKMEIAV